MDKTEVLKMLRQACKDAGSRRAWARANEMSAQYVNDVLSRKREPSDRIVEALGLVRRVSFEPAKRPPSKGKKP